MQAVRALLRKGEAGVGRTHAGLMLTALVVGLIGVSLAAAGHGAVPLSAAQVLAIWLQPLGIDLPVEVARHEHLVMWEIRLPRVLMAILVGAALAVSGAALQGLFRNPLADPALIGVSSGAAVSAAAVMSTGWVAGAGVLARFSVPLAAFAGGVVTTLLIYRLATVQGRTQVTTMLLGGIAITALAGALLGLLSYLADDATLRAINYWTMGSLGGASWSQLVIVLPLLLAAMTALPARAQALNALLLGEAEAGHLGFNVQRVKLQIIMLVALAVGAAVSVSGIISFVGLVVPHLLRALIGPDHRYLLPGSALLGGLLLVLADLLARTWIAPAELPIGVVTALMGAPFFLWLLWQQRQRSYF